MTNHENIEASEQNFFESYLSNHYQNFSVPANYQSSRKLFFKHNYLKLLPLKKSSVILDIGPGYGEIINLLHKEYHYEQLQAVDLSPEVVNHCNTLIPGCATLVTNTTQYLLERPVTFDCIFLFHVLEHIPKSEIVSFLSAIRKSLCQTGQLFVEVPNMANPVTGANARYADFTHTVGFNSLSLEDVLRYAGFSKVNVFGLKTPPVTFPRIMQSVAQKVIEMPIKFMMRAYGVSRIPPLSVAICATAFK
jgi:2-polyprenyl-3-methyl-5-hydroxy-6-metoxy-1,4-benzoquinol methylase